MMRAVRWFFGWPILLLISAALYLCVLGLTVDGVNHDGDGYWAADGFLFVLGTILLVRAWAVRYTVNRAPTPRVLRWDVRLGLFVVVLVWVTVAATVLVPMTELVIGVHVPGF